MDGKIIIQEIGCSQINEVRLPYAVPGPQCWAFPPSVWSTEAWSGPHLSWSAGTSGPRSIPGCRRTLPPGAGTRLHAVSMTTKTESDLNKKIR